MMLSGLTPLMWPFLVQRAPFFGVSFCSLFRLPFILLRHYFLRCTTKGAFSFPEL